MAIQLTPALEERLELLAVQLHSHPDQVAEASLQREIADQEEVLAALQEAEDDFSQGRTKEHAEVVALFADVLNCA